MNPSPRALPLILVGLLVACSGCAPSERPLGRSSLGGSLQPEIAFGNLERRLVLSGELVAEESTVAVAPVVRIWPLQVRWLRPSGSLVERGDRILEFDNAQLASRLEDQRSAIVAAESRLDQATAGAAAEESAAELEVARQRAALAKARLQADLPPGLVAVQEMAQREHEVEAAKLRLQQAETTWNSKREGGAARVAAARLALEAARTQLDRTEFDLERLVLRAPSAGVLLIAESMEGETLRLGDQAWPGTTVARIPDLSTLIVQALLFDVDDGMIGPGASARVALDAFPEERLSGVVRDVEEIAQPVSPKSDRRAFRVVVEAEGLDPERMRPGMSVKVEVQLPEIESSRLVDRAALRWIGEEPHLNFGSASLEPVDLLGCSGSRCALADDPRTGSESTTPLGGGP